MSLQNHGLDSESADMSKQRSSEPRLSPSMRWQTLRPFRESHTSTWAFRISKRPISAKIPVESSRSRHDLREPADVSASASGLRLSTIRGEMISKSSAEIRIDAPFLSQRIPPRDNCATRTLSPASGEPFSRNRALSE